MILANCLFCYPAKSTTPVATTRHQLLSIFPHSHLDAELGSPTPSSESWGDFSPDISLSSLSEYGYESPTISEQHSDDLRASPEASLSDDGYVGDQVVVVGWW